MRTSIQSLRAGRGAGRAGRGMAIVSTMLVLLGLLALTLLGVIAGTQRGGNGLMNTTGNGLQSAARQTQSVAAFNVAESGVEYTLQWMHTLSGPPSLTTSFPLPAWTGHPGSAGVTYALGGGTFSVTIFPDAANQVTIINGAITSTPKRYLIQSTGTYQGVSQTVLAYVQQASFGKYAYFTDNDVAGEYLVGGLDSFDGPVHSNNTNGTPTDIVWVDNKPIFKYQGNDAFTYSGSVNWNHNAAGNTQTPSSTSDWASVAAFGAAGVSQTPTIPLPTVNLKQQYAAMGQTMPNGAVTPPVGTPLTSGVTVTPGGGIYVHCVNSANANDTPPNGGPVNDVQQMVLSVDGNGNQVITIQQNNDLGTLTQTQITLDKANNATHVQSGPENGNSGTFHMTSKPDVSGVTNGVIYCDGNIGKTQAVGRGGFTAPSGAGEGLSGTIADNQGLTITTDPSKNVDIDGSLTYNTKRATDANGNPLPLSDPANATFLQKAGVLGLVGNTVQTVDNDANGNRLGDMEIDATMLAGNTMQVVDATGYYWDTNSSNAVATGSANGTTYYAHWVHQPHNLLMMGGVINATSGLTGAMSGSPATLVCGYNTKYSYDARMANNPPPFFPTTSNQYDILSWQRVAAPLQ